ncbi:MAG: hypothetical protein J6P98_02800 [Clostridia bacterium]|nr:hypothetical protein [Clostridia bacterium]
MSKIFIALFALAIALCFLAACTPVSTGVTDDLPETQSAGTSLQEDFLDKLEYAEKYAEVDRAFSSFDSFWIVDGTPAYPDYYGGRYTKGGKVFVLLTDLNKEAEVRYLVNGMPDCVEFVECSHSLNELARFAEAAKAELIGGGFTVCSVGTVQSDNRALITVPKEELEAARALIAMAYGESGPIEIAESSEWVNN